MCVQEDTTRTAHSTLGCENSALWTTWEGAVRRRDPAFLWCPGLKCGPWPPTLSLLGQVLHNGRPQCRPPVCRPDSGILSRVKKGGGQGSLVSNSWQISSWVFTILSYFICLKFFQKKKWNFLVSLILILNFSSVCLFALCSGQFSNLFLTFGQHVFTSVTSLLISVFFFKLQAILLF